MFIRDRATLLNLRIRALKSKQCAVKENNYVCPEVFLDAVADKLASMAVLFLQVELVSEFYYQVNKHPQLTD
jgi:dynamin-like GTPase MGM1, mitochondrial